MSYTLLAILAAVLVVICTIIFLMVNKKKPASGVVDARVIEKYSDISSKILELKEADDIFNTIGDGIHKLCGNCFVLVNSYDRLYDQFYTKGYFGVNNLIQKGLQMFSADYVNAAFKLDDESKKILISGRLTEFDGGLHKISSGKMPKEVANEIERFFKMKKFYARGLVSKGLLFGNAMIIPIYGHDIENKENVEAAIDLISDALYKKMASH